MEFFKDIIVKHASALPMEEDMLLLRELSPPRAAWHTHVMFN